MKSSPQLATAWESRAPRIKAIVQEVAALQAKARKAASDSDSKAKEADQPKEGEQAEGRLPTPEQIDQVTEGLKEESSGTGPSEADKGKGKPSD